MEQTLIPVNLGTRLILQLRQLSDRIPSKLVGLEHGKYLILSIPTLSPSDLSAYFKQGKSMVIRYVHEGAALGFESYVMGIIIQPVRLVFISYPDTVQDMNLRKHKRGDCYLPAEILFEDKPVHGFILDISRGGCGFTAKIKKDFNTDALAVGSSIFLKFPIPGVEGKLSIGCVIRNARTDHNGLFLGLQFWEFISDQKEKLFTYLEEMELMEESEE